MVSDDRRFSRNQRAQHQPPVKPDRVKVSAEKRSGLCRPRLKKPLRLITRAGWQRKHDVEAFTLGLGLKQIDSLACPKKAVKSLKSTFFYHVIGKKNVYKRSYAIFIFQTTGSSLEGEGFALLFFGRRIFTMHLRDIAFRKIETVGLTRSTREFWICRCRHLQVLEHGHLVNFPFVGDRQKLMASFLSKNRTNEKQNR